MKIRLSNNDRIHFDWTKQGALSIQLFRPGNLRDGHGLLLSGTAMLDGTDLQNFLAALQPPKRTKAQQPQEVTG